MGTMENTANAQGKQSTPLPVPSLTRPDQSWEVNLPDAVIPFDSKNGRQYRSLRLWTGCGCVRARRIQRAPDGRILVRGEMPGVANSHCLLILDPSAKRVQWYSIAWRCQAALQHAIRFPAWVPKEHRKSIESLIMVCAKYVDKIALDHLAEEILSGVRRSSGRRKRTEGEQWLARQLATVGAGPSIGEDTPHEDERPAA